MDDRILRFLRRAAILAAVIPMLCPAALAQRHWNAPRIVTTNCSGCHGIHGNAQLSYFPRLAGLNAVYAEGKIAQFQTAPPPHVDELLYRMITPHASKGNANGGEARTNMTGIAHAINDQQTKESAAWFALQKPARGRSGSSALIEQGKALFLQGLPAQGLLACQTCHGAQAQGKAKVPRLAGQNGSYLLAEMTKFKAGDRQHAPEMTMVAKAVDIEQFRALAAYLQSL